MILQLILSSLRGARKAQPSLLDGTRLELHTDYSAGVTPWRSGFKGIRAPSELGRGIDTSLTYPATVRVKVMATTNHSTTLNKLNATAFFPRMHKMYLIDER